MARYVLEREQFLPIPLERAWSFFSTPRNLAHITPPDMGFVIDESFDDAPMHEGQKIGYQVRPMLGIPVRWITYIAQVKAPFAFVDMQLKGPYKRWWHVHEFEPVEGGVRMKDRVEYELPLGPLGALFHDWLVGPRLQRIFDFRYRTLERLFKESAL
ncbi:MAG: SRPBCC family protein [Flavobacteriales bacterium]|nr:SRPBCC family protein [Flavobacteriales bacterium]